MEEIIQCMSWDDIFLENSYKTIDCEILKKFCYQSNVNVYVTRNEITLQLLIKKRWIPSSGYEDPSYTGKWKEQNTAKIWFVGILQIVRMEMMSLWRAGALIVTWLSSRRDHTKRQHASR